ncbi:hypothetical protein E4U54_002900, partial [Claviceps lovelessii]
MHSLVLGLSLSLALFTTASGALGNAAPGPLSSHKSLPKAFIYELSDTTATKLTFRQESTALLATLGENAKIVNKFDSALLRGVSVQYRNHKEAHAAAAKMAKTPGVKKVWPVHHYPRPDVKFTSLPPGSTFRHDLASVDNDTF